MNHPVAGFIFNLGRSSSSGSVLRGVASRLATMGTGWSDSRKWATLAQHGMDDLQDEHPEADAVDDSDDLFGLSEGDIHAAQQDT